MIAPFQFPEKIQIPNDLWDNPDWICEESYSGYRVLFQLLPNSNKLHVFHWKHYGNELKDVSQYFPLLTSTKTEIPFTELDCLLIAPNTQNKAYISSLFLNGPLGAEKMQFNKGNVEILLLDIFTYKNTNLMDFPWIARKDYLDLVFNEIKPNFDAKEVHIIRPKTVNTHKRAYFEWLCQNKANGIILKAKNDPYRSGFGRSFLKVMNTNGFKENVSLKATWMDEPVSTHIDSQFDYDTFLAMKSLDNLKLD